MSGLIVKDIRLIKNQGMVTILLFAGVMGVLMINTMNPQGFVAYASVMGAIYAFNTISYDSYENGYSFLFTLPVSRKLYAAEKYVLAVIFSLGASLVGGVAVELVKGDITQLLSNCLSYLLMWAVVLWMPIVMLPLQLKFGAENSRIVMILVVGICAAAGYLVMSEGKVVERAAVFLKSLNETVGDAGLLAIAFMVTVAAFVLSMCISMRIMEKKEF